jgi:hypothetical protein
VRRRIVLVCVAFLLTAAVAAVAWLWNTPSALREQLQQRYYDKTDSVSHAGELLTETALRTRLGSRGWEVYTVRTDAQGLLIVQVFHDGKNYKRLLFSVGGDPQGSVAVGIFVPLAPNNYAAGGDFLFQQGEPVWHLGTPSRFHRYAGEDADVAARLREDYLACTR